MARSEPARQFTLGLLEPEESDELIRFFRRFPSDMLLRRPDIQLIRAAAAEDAFVFRLTADGAICGSGVVFRYMKGTYAEAGAARITEELGGYGMNEWKYGLHQFLHRIRALHSFLGNTKIEKYFGIVRAAHATNIPQLRAVGFRRWPNRPPKALVQHRRSLIRKGWERQKEPMPDMSAEKYWMSLSRSELPRIAREVLHALRERRRRNKRDIKFDLSRVKMRKDESGRLVPEEPAKEERIVLHLDMRLFTERRHWIDYYADMAD